MTEQTVNIPLLRKAVEWAEAEAAKPIELCEWFQAEYVVTPETRKDPDSLLGCASEFDDESDRALRAALVAKSDQCGTCYCIAGYVAQAVNPALANTFHDGDETSSKVAMRELGLSRTGASRLFAAHNTITQVREIAESIAGERL